MRIGVTRFISEASVVQRMLKYHYVAVAETLDASRHRMVRKRVVHRSDHMGFTEKFVFVDSRRSSVHRFARCASGNFDRVMREAQPDALRRQRVDNLDMIPLNRGMSAPPSE